MENEEELRLWEVIGCHNAVRARRAAERLTPEEREAQPILEEWRKIGCWNVSLADAVAFLREQKEAAPPAAPESAEDKLLAEWASLGVTGLTIADAKSFLQGQRERGLIK